jgi:hypothetical protein
MFKSLFLSIKWIKLMSKIFSVFLNVIFTLKGKMFTHISHQLILASNQMYPVFFKF